VNPDDDPAPGAAHDEWVVLRCQMGEREAFDLLIARWHPLLWRYAISLTNDLDTAADAVQDVWLRVLRGLVRLRDAAKFRAWLFGIARRVLMDRLRVRYAGPVFDAVDLTEVPQAVTDDDLEEDLSLLQTELARLPMLEREVLTLFYLKELNLNEIAEIAAIPVGTVKSRLFRARHLLRQHLVTKGVRS
jgi:RNA polymerase sigma factor (sigma-70 family)